MKDNAIDTQEMLKPFISTQVAQITRYEKRSSALMSESSDIKVEDADTLKIALDKRKEINAHIKEVANVRLGITREFDKVKTQFTDAEKRVLKPADEAKKIIGEKIISYEEEQEKLRIAEVERVNSVIDTFTTNVRSLRTIKAVKERRDEVQEIYDALPDIDRVNPIIKIAIAQTMVALSERKQEISAVELSESEAAQAAAKRRRQVAMAEQEADEAEKAQIKVTGKAPKTGVRMVTKFKITDAIEVPFEYCVPSDQLIRKAIAAGVAQIPGVEIYQEKSF